MKYTEIRKRKKSGQSLKSICDLNKSVFEVSTQENDSPGVETSKSILLLFYPFSTETFCACYLILHVSCSIFSPCSWHARSCSTTTCTRSTSVSTKASSPSTCRYVFQRRRKESKGRLYHRKKGYLESPSRASPSKGLSIIFYFKVLDHIYF